MNLNRTTRQPQKFRAVSRRSDIAAQGGAHGVDIDAVENPVKLLSRKRHHRRLPAWPSEPIFGQSLQDHHKTGPIEEQELQTVTAAIAKGKDRRRKRVELHRLLHQDRKAVDAGAEVDRFAVQVDLEISAQSEHGPMLQ
ncbi:hypothetical protein T190_05715 [Sinorhizobium meliloti CCBAU 01290]|nr:hypothetical protein T190_05715 [Sinorhizobium meliloti CCBAU 01290]